METVGRKFDGGKRRWSLLLGSSLLPALREVTDVLMFGAKKYGDDNWLNVTPPRQRYYDALERHVTDWYAGERSDPESGLHHLAHAACCVLFLLAFDLSGKLESEAK